MAHYTLFQNISIMVFYYLLIYHECDSYYKFNYHYTTIIIIITYIARILSSRKSKRKLSAERIWINVSMAFANSPPKDTYSLRIGIFSSETWTFRNKKQSSVSMNLEFRLLLRLCLDIESSAYYKKKNGICAVTIYIGAACAYEKNHLSFSNRSPIGINSPYPLPSCNKKEQTIAFGFSKTAPLKLKDSATQMMRSFKMNSYSVQSTYPVHRSTYGAWERSKVPASEDFPTLDGGLNGKFVLRP